MIKKAIRPGANGTDQGLHNWTALQFTASRTCGRCGQEKLLDYFATDRARAGGRRTICADCRRDYDHERYYRCRCRLYGLQPVVEQFSRKDVVEHYGNRCAYCTVGDFESLDHFVPVGAGGPHTLGNARPCCRSCNSLKFWLYDRPLIPEFRRSQDVLEPSAPLLKLQGQRNAFIQLDQDG
jgi:HNH endonuclease